ncbi:ubiquitinyl hydrolase 1 [Elasticomyces elasticus]|nr:ubiquitinyl hydrolase 1 [Elasticomyces elasticus]
MADTEQTSIDPHNTNNESSSAPSGVKRFVPLENNPEVMTSLVHKLGLSQSLAFQDVFSIDDPDLLAFVPRPAHALLLVFPCTETYESFRAQEDKDRQEYSGSGPDEEVVWYKQTIGNACGLIGLLHCVSNGKATSMIEPDSGLATLLKDAVPLEPTARADLLYESQALEEAHQSAAAGGDTAAPSADDRVDLHYVCFVKSKNNHLWEMDGRRKGPLDRGELAADEDVLSEKALRLGVRSFLKREESAGGGELRFSLIVLAESLD